MFFYILKENINATPSGFYSTQFLFSILMTPLRGLWTSISISHAFSTGHLTIPSLYSAIGVQTRRVAINIEISTSGFLNPEGMTLVQFSFYKRCAL
jgi:hypothetical protein